MPLKHQYTKKAPKDPSMLENYFQTSECFNLRTPGEVASSLTRLRYRCRL